jgi:presequence protease
MSEYGFNLIDKQEISEIKTIAKHYKHIKTGAKLLSLENNDENKVFCISFRTPPKDSTGVAHIMEHCVLCGSQKYPVKEPFVELMKGSLNTFLNAFTFPDKTCYPLASQNIRDFYNLIDVYVDAVFHPLITKYIFMQEGWHYEIESTEKPLTYKGVVYNEMKGAYSDPDSTLYRSSLRSLFPDNPYGVDSGGDPNVIPELTYEQFIEFHRTYYHPSNAYIFFYGDDDPSERLKIMDNYLKEFRFKDIPSSIQLQPRFTDTKKIKTRFDPGEENENRKAMFVINWLLTDDADEETQLALSILAHILIGTSASPLRKALIDSAYGEDLAGVGLDTEIRQSYFSTGLKGLEVDVTGEPIHAKKVEELIFSTLRKLADEGIDPKSIEASLNTIEFQLRENNTGSYPRGLLLMLRSLTTSLYDRDPIIPLAFDRPLETIKRKIANGEAYFENLLRELFLNNAHQTKVIMNPEKGVIKEFETKEKERLSSIQENMQYDELLAAIKDNQRLKEIQNTPDSEEALAKIPTLKLEDLEKGNKTIPIQVNDDAPCPVIYHDLFTNEIVYLDIGFDIHVLDMRKIPYISLFGRALTEMGTKKQDFVKLSQRIGRSTGGIYTTNIISSKINQDTSAAWLFVRGKATIDHASEMMNILEEILLDVNLDNKERFLQIALEEKASLEANLVPAGHQVINTRLNAQFSEAGWVDELSGGISYLFFLRKLIQEIQNNWQHVLENLETIRRALINNNRMIVNVTVDQENWQRFSPILESFLNSIPSEAIPLQKWQPIDYPSYQGLTMPTQVNFVGKGFSLSKKGHQLGGAINVISNYLRSTWLWEKVRVQGGAYGGFCLFDRYSNVFSFLSYRDPNLFSTLNNYDLTVNYLQNLKLNHEELTKSIIGAIGKLDTYLLPDAKGYRSLIRYLVGDSDQIRQQLREQILNTNMDDFHIFGEVLSQSIQNGSVVVMGAEDNIKDVNLEKDLKFQIYKVF